jgi:excisionase family DNA binding protein
MSILTKPIHPTEREATLAGEGLELLKNTSEDMIIMLGNEKTLILPTSVVGLLQSILEEMSRGNAVSVVSLEAKLTTQQAADLLNVSRPFVIKLVDDGVLLHRMIGSHRRVLLKDVLEYREKMQHTSEEAMQELARLSQEMGTY